MLLFYDFIFLSFFFKFRLSENFISEFQFWKSFTIYRKSLFVAVTKKIVIIARKQYYNVCYNVGITITIKLTNKSNKNCCELILLCGRKSLTQGIQF